MIRLKIALTLLAAAIMGCTSISSTLVNRTDNDVFIGNSNGNPKDHCDARPYKGVPITVRVPTHLDVVIKEQIFLASTGGNAPVRQKTSSRHLYVESAVVETDKVFTVDIKRPAAGVLNYTMTFGTNTNGLDNSQYFSALKSHIQDDTIKDVTTALKTLSPLFAKKASAGGTATDGDTQIILDSRTVAWKRFDIDACDFEQQVAAFVDRHLNCSNNCENYMRPSAPSFQSK